MRCRFLNAEGAEGAERGWVGRGRREQVRERTLVKGYRGFSLALLARPPATFVRPLRGGEVQQVRVSDRCEVSEE
jgi:hypothetical protein